MGKVELTDLEFSSYEDRDLNEVRKSGREKKKGISDSSFTRFCCPGDKPERS